MKKKIIYAVAGLSAAILARKFIPSLVREIRQYFM
jgi:hypothetical protein